MPPSAASDWRERAGGFLSSSSIKLRQATQVAGSVVGDAAKNAGTSVAGAAERAGSAVRSRWSLLQAQQQRQENTFAQDRNLVQDRPTVQERWRTASSSLKKGLQETKELATIGFLDTKEKVAVGLVETKEKLAVGKVKVEEAARKAAERSKILIAEWRQKGMAGKGVFGVPLDVLAQRQKSQRPIPAVVIKCVDYLVLSGLNAEYIFKKDGNHRVVDRLINTLNNDHNSALQGANPVDVAAVLKVFFQMLPEPLLMFENYDTFVAARGNVARLREVVATLPPANYLTLECLTALLLRISQKSTINKMDSHSLAFEFAPVLLWQRGKSKSQSGKSRPLAAGSFRLSRLTPVIERPREEAAALSEHNSSNGSREEAASLSEHQLSNVSVKVNVEDAGSEWPQVQEGENGHLLNGHSLDLLNGHSLDLLNGHSLDLLNDDSLDERNGDLSAQIPLDDDEPLSVDFAIVEAVQCLIDQHNMIFADAVEVVWQDLDS